MRVGIAADHGGFAMREQIKAALKLAGHEVTDFGAMHLDPADDYPDFVIPLAKAVVRRKVERGIAICSSGVGACIFQTLVRIDTPNELDYYRHGGILPYVLRQNLT